MTLTSDVSVDGQRKARPWRYLSAGSGLLLAACFFLPAIQSCNSDIVPASDFPEIVAEALQQPDWFGKLLALAMWAPVLLHAYVFGLLLALTAITGLLNKECVNRWLGRCVISLLLLTAICSSAAILGEVLFQNSGWPPVSEPGVWMACVIGPLLTIAYLFAAWRQGARLDLCSAFLASWWLVCWFMYWATDGFDRVRYGLLISLVASVLLLIGRIGEGRVLGQHTWLRTIGHLVIGRLGRDWGKQGHCPKCQYLLYGLTEPRCPECGRPFTSEEAGLLSAAPPAAMLGRPQGTAL